MQFLMSTVEDGTVAGPGLSAIETAITFFVIPVGMFFIIAGLSWIASRTRTTKTHSSKTSIN